MLRAQGGGGHFWTGEETEYHSITRHDTSFLLDNSFVDYLLCGVIAEPEKILVITKLPPIMAELEIDSPLVLIHWDVDSTQVVSSQVYMSS